MPLLFSISFLEDGKVGVYSIKFDILFSFRVILKEVVKTDTR